MCMDECVCVCVLGNWQRVVEGWSCLYRTVPFLLLLPVMHLSKPKPRGSEEHRHFAATVTMTVPWRWESQVTTANLRCGISNNWWNGVTCFIDVRDSIKECRMCTHRHTYTHDPCVSNVHLWNDGYDVVCRLDRLYAGYLWQPITCTCMHNDFFILWDALNNFGAFLTLSAPCFSVYSYSLCRIRLNRTFNVNWCFQVKWFEGISDVAC